MAAKLPEYLATGLPIIYLGQTYCDAATLLRAQPGCDVLAPDDVLGVVEALRATRNGPYKRELAWLSRSALAGRLANVFDRALVTQESAG